MTWKQMLLEAIESGKSRDEIVRAIHDGSVEGLYSQEESEARIAQLDRLIAERVLH
jgi:hypothetical protein